MGDSFMERMKTRHNRYPRWICIQCGERYGTRRAHAASMHVPDLTDADDHCGWCGSNCHLLSDPADFGYPGLLYVMKA